MRHSLISPARLHVFRGSRRYQKRRMCVIQGCANLWNTSISFPTSYLRRRKGPAVPERDLQKMDRVKTALRHGFSNPRGRT